MKVSALYSGGKDSSLAVQKVLELGFKVTSLVSIQPESPESYMFHYPNSGLTEMQAEAAEIPLIKHSSGGVKEEEVGDMEKALGQLKGGISGVVVGAIASEYQRKRVEDVCRKLGLDMIAPLWGIDPQELWKELLAKGFVVMIVGVACDGLGKEWLGRIVDEKALMELDRLSKRHRFHLGGEGGEFETFVLDAPFFGKRLVVKDGETEWNGDSGYYHIRDVVLKEKPGRDKTIVIRQVEGE
jgi:diphthine-ammonia ligase